MHRLATAVLTAALALTAPACADQGPRGIRAELRPGHSLTWHGRCFVGHPRVNGRKGYWADGHAAFVWPRYRHGRWTVVSFNGIRFFNGWHITVQVSAHCFTPGRRT